MLFGMVREHKIDLLDVPLFPVCEAYFLYVLEDQSDNLESCGVALAALAYLLDRKARLLIPPVEAEEEDEDSDVLFAIEPYAHEFNPAIDDLYTLHHQRELFFFRTPESQTQVYELPLDTGTITSADLARTFERLLARAKPDPIASVNTTRKSLSEVIIEVMKALPQEFTPLEEIMTGDFYRSDVVWWFLALLELIRLGQARVRLEESTVLFARGSAS